MTKTVNSYYILDAIHALTEARNKVSTLLSSIEKDIAYLKTMGFQSEKLSISEAMHYKPEETTTL